jgi:putative ABC transport system ATP-binding protein
MVAQRNMAVHCRGVTKTYGSGDAAVQALRGIDLEVREGELMMLVGPSGCGKTTLISVVAGILDHDGGQCTVFGRNFLEMEPKERTLYRGRHVGFVFQAFNLIPPLTAAENVAVPLMINGMARRSAIHMAEELLERVEMGNRTGSLPAELSGGQQQRVAIARAMVHNPRLIVCDEPTSALDHETGHHVMEILRSIAMTDGRSLIIVTHDARIFGFADRIARMDDGHIEKVVNSAGDL